MGRRCRKSRRFILLATSLICDYSSTMFDFANLGRPIVVYGADWEDYRALRGTYFDIMKNRRGRSRVLWTNSAMYSLQSRTGQLLHLNCWRPFNPDSASSMMVTPPNGLFGKCFLVRTQRHLGAFTAFLTRWRLGTWTALARCRRSPTDVENELVVLPTSWRFFVRPA
jgi:CDP-glycerol glycerophosphotransferase (TagB/SpsB family)